MKTDFTIGGRTITPGAKPFLIAEAGINHNGSLDKAIEMIQAAKKCGADAVKFQTFKASEFVADKSLQFTYKSQGKSVTESMHDMFARVEFSKDNWKKIRSECDRAGIVFLSTPQNTTDLELLLELGVDAVKVGSDDFTNEVLLKRYRKTGLPLIVSSGMADLAEIYRSLEWIGTLDGYPTVLLICTSEYPCPPQNVNLAKLRTLGTLFPQLPLGFSDHTQGPLASSIAVGLGAVVFEKHFTLSHDLPGPDHWFSEEPKDLEAWVTAVRTGFQMLGNPVPRPTTGELEMRTLARRSIVALSDIRRGETLDDSKIGLKRPGDGLPASLYESVLSRSALRDIRAGEQIKFGDFV